MRRLALCAALALALPGCGGPDRAERERTAFRQFKAKVQAGCDEVAGRIVGRGMPPGTGEIEQRARSAVDDTQRLVALADGIALPRRTARRVKPFRDQLNALDELLRGELPRLQGNTSLDGAVRAAPRVIARVDDVATSAGRVGIRCWSEAAHGAFAEVLHDELYLAWFRAGMTATLRTLAPLNDDLHHRRNVREALLGKVRVLRITARGFKRVESPDDVRAEAREFAVDLQLYRDFIAQTQREVQVRSTLSVAYIARYNRRTVQLGHAVDTAIRRLVRALEQGIPAPPAPPPKGFS